jgi:hypothetical protein
MMQHTTIQALGQARLAELHRQARRDAQARGTRRHPRRRRASGLLATVTGWARRRAPAQVSP